MDYRFFSPGDWSDGVARFKQDDRLREGEVVLAGDCPRCEHAMDVVISLHGIAAVPAEPAVVRRKPVGRRGKRAPATKSRVFQVTASCNCHMQHADRPDDVSVGCGAFGNLVVGGGN